ncbi:hypothetical protein MNV49_005873 [Pseudohyphozyma bogoriensis]|nr:hypothetical protein MNV49_005873 [Pseudohyphozyma bogoriensis]
MTKEASDLSKGDHVSWNWGGGKPSGTVQDVVEDHAEIKTRNDNTVSRDGDDENPAVKLKADSGSSVIKKASELNGVKENETGGSGGGSQSKEDSADYEMSEASAEPEQSAQPESSVEPSAEPSVEPSVEPSAEPSAEPFAEPEDDFIEEDSVEPEASMEPEESAEPTPAPEEGGDERVADDASASRPFTRSQGNVDEE